MKKARSLVVITMLLILALAVAPSLAKPPVLFEGIEFGTPAEKVLEITGAEICTGNTSDLSTLCVDERDKYGVTWDTELKSYDNKFVMVRMVAGFTKEALLSAKQGLQEKYFCIMITTEGGSHLDLVALAQKLEKTAFRKTIDEFEAKAIQAGKIEYSFLEASAILPDAVKSKTAKDFLKHVKKDVQQMTLGLKSNINFEGKKFTFIELKQTAPYQFVKMVKAAKEKKQIEPEQEIPADIAAIKSDVMPGYETVTIGTVLDKVFENPSWEEFESKIGERAVIFRGIITGALREGALEYFWDSTTDKDKNAMLQLAADKLPKEQVSAISERHLNDIRGYAHELWSAAYPNYWRVGDNVEIKWLYNLKQKRFALDSMASDGWVNQTHKDILTVIYKY